MLPETQNKINKNYEAAIKLLREIMVAHCESLKITENIKKIMESNQIVLIAGLFLIN